MLESEIYSLLQQVPFFTGFSQEQLQGLAEAGEIRSFEANETLFEEGDEANELFLILSGLVQVDGHNPKGEKIKLAELQSGQFFGELSLADGGSRTASVKTLIRSRFFVLSRQRFLEQISRSPQLLSQVITAISQKIRKVNTQYFEEQINKQRLSLEMEKARQRTTARLMQGLAEQFNEPLDTLQAAAMTLQMNESQLPASLHSCSEDIQQHVGRLYMLMQSFRSLTGESVLNELETVHWNDFWHEMFETYRMSSFRQFPMQLELAPDAAMATWQGYPMVLREALMHLFLNVEQHAYPEEDGPVRVNVSMSEAGFLIRIIDSGRGIPVEDIDKVTEPFFTTAAESGCNGLGLPIVAGIMENTLGGQLSLESDLTGTSVSLQLPFQSPVIS